jgi:type IV secretion system protein VirB10
MSDEVVQTQSELETERRTSAVSQSRKFLSRRQVGVIGMIAAASVLAWIVLHPTGKKEKAHERPQQLQPAKPQPIPVAPDPIAEPVVFPQPFPPAPPAAMQQSLVSPMPTPSPEKAETARRQILFNAEGWKTRNQEPAAGTTQQIAAQQEGPLGDALKAPQFEAAHAVVMRNPTMTVGAGRMIPCVMQTAVDSQLPGFATCVVEQDVVGERGGVVLLDRGTRIFGQVKTEMVQNGRNRVFVLWTKATTPKGIVIPIDSPAVDSLGRSGVEGSVDTHWRERFGTALLFTVIEGVSSLASSYLSSGINMHGPASAAQEVLRGSANIPPTITINQGDRIGIMVARDWEFSNVYGLQLTRGR